MKISELEEGFYRGRGDAYDRDHRSATGGFGRKDSLAYQLDGGANDEYVNGEEDEVRAYRQYMAKHHKPEPKADEPHDVHIDGKKWKTFGSKSHAQNVARKLQGNGKYATIHKSLEETSDAPITAANVGVGAVYKNKPVNQPKNKDGTAKNALDMKSTNLLTGGSIKRS